MLALPCPVSNHRCLLPSFSPYPSLFRIGCLKLHHPPRQQLHCQAKIQSLVMSDPMYHMFCFTFAAVADALRTSLGPRGMDKMVSVFGHLHLRLEKKLFFVKKKKKKKKKHQNEGGGRKTSEFNTGHCRRQNSPSAPAPRPVLMLLEVSINLLMCVVFSL